MQGAFYLCSPVCRVWQAPGARNGSHITLALGRVIDRWLAARFLSAPVQQAGPQNVFELSSHGMVYSHTNERQYLSLRVHKVGSDERKGQGPVSAVIGPSCRTRKTLFRVRPVSFQVTRLANPASRPLLALVFNHKRRQHEARWEICHMPG